MTRSPNMLDSVTPGPTKSEARASVARMRPARWSASASVHILIRTCPLVPVAASGVSSVIGADTGP